MLINDFGHLLYPGYEEELTDAQQFLTLHAGESKTVKERNLDKAAVFIGNNTYVFIDGSTVQLKFSMSEKNEPDNIVHDENY
ncbi:hypothetical protein VAS14_00091 [Vibrio angustum S14]|uniref:Uncharacterized protein n=1 Tax=Photobacterium angustum (strain S14 / CCUG 15956) TaxID=314292 RepID=Q1ZJV1_PHOAS|nr:hypothetical protein [Photobacterium angustum]EAS62421.1 hypothetical protein VAS14_00091 [Vibrio angustum S14] [Photobacterium angustum S14]